MKKEQNNTAIGTLILYIFMILVAAIGAGFLVQSSMKTQAILYDRDITNEELAQMICADNAMDVVGYDYVKVITNKTFSAQESTFDVECNRIEVRTGRFITLGGLE
jgi:archaellum component FlaG (FlaF/FlaG flagellin family)